jgi:CobQ-like glutamine amidotransferase family enzyme/UDP-N-acetylmuramyl tripeptide synthase
VAVSAASRRLGFGGGSVIGGRVGLLLEPDLLALLAADRRVALVSGTNGKTTTTHLLAAALGGTRSVATSPAGANLPPGLALALAASAPGVPAVLEVDEAYLGAVAAALRPDVVALLNLSRDQLDRVSEVRMVANRWRRTLTGLPTTVVANADDPLVVWAAATAPTVIWVAAGLLWRGDAVGCPACDGHIVFAASDGPEAGSAGWSCACGFARPDPHARLVGDEVVTADGRRLALDLLLPSRANRANAAIAVVAAGVLGVDGADALLSMSKVTDVEGRFARITHAGVAARLLLAKNPAGWAELLDLLDGGKDPVVIGINARVADGHDPSWLWDVPFERLAGRLVVATGERRRDLAVRLRYAGVAHTTVADQLEALGVSGAASLDYVGNYTAFQDLRRGLAGRRGGPHRQAETAAEVSTSDPDPAHVVIGALNVPSDTVVDEPGPARRRRSGPRRAAPGRAAPGRAGSGGTSALRVVVIYPDLLGTYGDGGNGRVLAARAAWRDIPVELVLAWSDAVLPQTADLYCLGGGEDGPQIQAAERLADGNLAAAVAAGATVLAVCAGYQIMGTAFPGPDGSLHGGVGLLDVSTVRGSGRRAVGEIVAEPLTVAPDLTPVPAGIRLARLTGFENHAGVTTIGPSARPLAQVLSGIGNGDGSGTDGARSGRVVGTYLHGPVLARNPRFADMLLALATGTAPAPLDDKEEEALHAERLHSASAGSGLWPGGVGPRWRRLVRVRRS